MNKKSEQKLLKSLVKLQEMESVPWIFKSIFIPVLWFLLGIIIFVAKKYYELGDIHPFVYIVIIMSIGTIIGFYSVYKHSYKNWSSIKPFVDTEKVKQRIHELEEI